MLAGDPTVGNPVVDLANTRHPDLDRRQRNFVPDCDLLNLQQQDLRDDGGDSAARCPTRSSAAGAEHGVRSGDAQRLGHARLQLGVLDQRAARAARRASASTSAISAAGTATSPSPTTAPSAPADYSAFSITAPLDSRLPGGGGYVDQRPLRPEPEQGRRRSTTTSTFADNYGNQIEHWNGVDVTVNAPAPQASCCRAA